MHTLRYSGQLPCVCQSALTSININLRLIKWTLRKVDVAIKETLTCVLARSILIYISTTMEQLGS